MNRKEYYRVEEKEPGHYRIGSDENVFMELFVGTERALLFDTGNGFGDIRGTVKALTDRPLVIVNSHGHGDHTGGNSQFEEECLLLPEDFALCRQHCGKVMRQANADTARHNYNFLTGEVRNILPDDFDEEAYVQAGTGKLSPLSKEEVFDLGGITLKVVWMPGHTRGCIGLLDEKTGTLYAGDALSSFIWLFLDEASTLTEYRQMLERAQDLPFDRFYAAHDAKVHDRETFEIWRETAEQLDFARGTVFDSPINADGSARICVREGYGPEDFGKPGYAAVVINRAHLV